VPAKPWTALSVPTQRPLGDIPHGLHELASGDELAKPAQREPCGGNVKNEPLLKAAHKPPDD